MDKSSLFDVVTAELLMSAKNCSVAEPTEHAVSLTGNDHTPEAIHSLQATAADGPWGHGAVASSLRVV